MKKLLLSILIFNTFVTHSNAQESEDEIKLDEIEILSSPRIEIESLQNSISVVSISREEIQNSTSTNVSELLQQIAGIDIRRRGFEGIQADLYIRGGSFDQTLLLIDGIKVEDPQTGHHTMNMTLPLEVIEKIEIIKGAAGRIYGQNAFTGAINIITKKDIENNISLDLSGGSFDQKRAAVTMQRKLKNSDLLINYNRKESEGYRYNTDFKNDEFFIKSSFKIKDQKISAIGAFNERKFGANGFYASPAAIDQYEETQASIVGLSTTYKKDELIIKPKLYWKRNQDMYVYLRQDPSVYRNLHISNKVGVEINASTPNDLGNLGIGFDLSKVSLSSNNLGDRNRTMLNIFIEQKIQFQNEKIDLTPGIAITYFSDVSTRLKYQNNYFNNLFFYPGMDLGYRINQNLTLYSNIGYTYRIPTYTDLFYSSPTTLGNENLKLEKALTSELGIKYRKENFNLNMSLYRRDASDIIDYVRNNETDPWQASNIREIRTNGFELNMGYKFYIGSFNAHQINIGFSNINDDLKETEFNFSRYALNSLKNQITSTYSFELFDKISSTIAFKNAKRLNEDKYTVIDFKTSYKYEKFTLSIILNNILDTEYTETNLVPMPGFNSLVGIKYSIN
ncbi:MAG: TonB-dependent receptor [Flavobacteriaceae bacterium]